MISPMLRNYYDCRHQTFHVACVTRFSMYKPTIDMSLP